MGFNIQGIATSKKFDSAEKLAETLRIGKIKKISEGCFEQAISYSIGDNEIFITEVENGTVITLGVGFDIQAIPLTDVSINGKAIRFMVSETAMAFGLEYLANGESIRTILHAEGENLMEEGSPLAIEAEVSDMTEIIFGLIGEVTGVIFYEIGQDHRSDHYCRI